MLGKPLYHVAAIETAAQNAVECYHHLGYLVLQSQVYQTEIVVAVEHVQVLDHLLVSDVAHAEAGSLVEDREGIAHTSVSLFGYHGERLFFILYAFLLSHHLQVVDGIGYRHSLKVVNLASAQDGRQNLMLLGSGEDEDDMLRWLFQRLEKGVEGCCREHVDLIDDKHFILAHLRRNAGLLHQNLNLVNTVVAGGIQLEDVVGTLLVEGTAALTFVACLAVFTRMLAVDCLRKNAGTSGFSHTSRTAEKIGVRQLAALHCILQSGGQCTLSDNRIEGHRTVLSCRNYILFHYFFLIDDAKITKKYYLCKQIRKK